MPDTEFKTLSPEELDKLPTGVASFREIRANQNVYVDKTALIYPLAISRKRYFLSRPRRFGKTLLINTLEALFQDGLKDFRGLAIDKLWHDTTYDVLHLNFATFSDFKTAAEFKTALYKQISGFMVDRPITESPSMKADSDPWSRFQSYLALRPLNKLVVLIDEYDTPLTHCLDNETLFTDISKILCQFYQILKDQSEALRFMLVTGICRFQHLGIFSGPNQLIDISMNPAFGTLTGYTADEILRYFHKYVLNAAHQLGISADECVDKLKFHYDGFCFDEDAATHVFSPWSVLNFFMYPQRGFRNYWYGTGGAPAVLMNYLKQNGIRSPEDYGRDMSISIDALQSSEELESLNDLSMLFHTGYLSIKGVSASGNLILNTSNNEVSVSLARLYAGRCVKSTELDSFADILLKSPPEKIIMAINRFIGSLDYRDFMLKDESSVRSVLQLCMMAVGFNPTIEVHNHKGRSDLEVKAGERYFVFELKYHREGSLTHETLLAEAIAQITDNQYGEQSFPELPHIRIALVFSQKERRFSHWQIC